ncbi:MAG TPA: alpha/beta hydrolase, partial [Polyangiaceae bacterium]|nr:alpha/beta hydrolase [Polyangiaceae bacterium]
GPEHWQSRWQALEPSFRRVTMPDWDRPDLETWLAVLDAAVKAEAAEPVIVAHSLGCLAVAHFAARGGRVRAALLVAVPEPGGPAWPEEAQSFAAVPLTPLPFPTLVVASRDDPYGSFEYAAKCAKAWGSALHDAGPAGHINAHSGLGDWAAGRKLLADVCGC